MYDEDLMDISSRIPKEEDIDVEIGIIKNYGIPDDNDMFSAICGILAYFISITGVIAILAKMFI